MAVVITAGAVDLDREGRDPAYVESIVKRSQKIVDKLELTDTVAAREVTTIIANRYFKLNDIYETRDAKVKLAKETLTGDAKQEAVKAAEAEKDAALYRTHFAFPADLSLYLDAKQIDAVKDGMTYGVVMVTYKATVDMIPTLKEEEKAQIMAWLVEAREFAIDAENSNKKHAAFGKYKGRINNYLSKRGYDLVKERKAWYERIKARGGKAAAGRWHWSGADRGTRSSQTPDALPSTYGTTWSERPGQWVSRLVSGTADRSCCIFPGHSVRPASSFPAMPEAPLSRAWSCTGCGWTFWS